MDDNLTVFLLKNFTAGFLANFICLKNLSCIIDFDKNRQQTALSLPLCDNKHDKSNWAD